MQVGNGLRSRTASRNRSTEGSLTDSRLEHGDEGHHANGVTEEQDRSARLSECRSTRPNVRSTMPSSVVVVNPAVVLTATSRLLSMPACGAAIPPITSSSDQRRRRHPLVRR